MTIGYILKLKLLFKRILVKEGELFVKNSNLAFYFWKILWLIGLIILGNVCLNFRNQIEQTSKETFDMIPFMWVE